MNLEGRVRNNQEEYRRIEIAKETLREIGKPLYSIGKFALYAGYGALGGVFAMSSVYKERYFLTEEGGRVALPAVMSSLMVIGASISSLVGLRPFEEHTDEFVKIGLPILLCTNFASYCYEKYKKAKRNVDEL